MRNKKWNRKIRSGLTLSLALMSLVLSNVFSAYAQEGEHGKIQVDVGIDNDNGQDVGIKDVDFVLYYVAAWENNSWSLTLKFDDYNVRDRKEALILLMQKHREKQQTIFINILKKRDSKTKRESVTRLALLSLIIWNKEYIF